MGDVIGYVGQNMNMHLDRIKKREKQLFNRTVATIASLGRLTQLTRQTDVFVLLGSSITPSVCGRKYHCNAITRCCWCGLIHQSSKKICCGLCWILMNVFRAKEQVTMLPKFTLLSIMAGFPALCKNCFLLFHLPVGICD